MGRVFRAYDPLGRRSVAIKTLRSSTSAQGVGDRTYRRFAREAQIAATLSHPAIVTIFDVHEEYFVMELLDGVSLAAMLEEQGPLAVDDALQILGPVADALDYAHAEGTLHRDIKAANIIVMTGMRPKLTDFGIARFRESIGSTAPGGLVGSPSYMAPEQFTTGRATPKSDQFSLAVVAYEALTGARPFEGESIPNVAHRIVHLEPPPIRSRRPELPVGYDAGFQRALAKDAQQRFPNCRGFLQALERGAQTAPEPVHSAPAGPVVVRRPHARPRRPAGFDATRTLRGFLDQGRGSRLALILGLALAGAALAATALALAPVVQRLAELRRAPSPSPMPAKAAIRVDTTPPHGQVQLDGMPAGPAPVTLWGVGAGRHTLSVALEGYEPATLELEVPAAGGLLPVHLSLRPASARGY
jgi:serine/threonine-protein kinase